MAITPGTRLGPYEVQSAIGAGGMGEVYRGRDTRLDRTVAIKVLPGHLSDNPALQQRLEREARAISALNHPNICTLYDIGHQDGVDFLVMEYVEGETLEKRLEKGPLPTPQVLAIARQIADALDRAHREGIVHRDLKPGNVMLTKAGAKLLDFGLAKPQSQAAANVALTAMTTEKPLTAEGMIVGTFQYMSPEQLEGREADARSDIFSFGAVLYEMTTGRRAFGGRTQASVIASILASEPPPITSIAPMSPPALDRLVRTCLAKDPEERWQTAHDVKLQLEAIEELGSQAGVPRTVVAVRRHRQRIFQGVAVLGWLLAVGALIAAMVYARRWQSEQQVVRSELNPPGDAEWFGFSGHMTVSPNGRYLAFVANDGKVNALWVQDLTNDVQQRLAGTDEAMFPFWSPDGKRIGFFQTGKLKAVAAGGGPIDVICDAADGRGASWSPKGWIVFTPNIEDGIYKVPEGGGTPVMVTKKPPPGGTSRNPEFLPDGRHFLFVDRAGGSRDKAGAVYAGSLDGMEPKLVLEEGSNTAYFQGHVLYFKDGNLVAQDFDPDSLKVSGNPVALAEKIEYWRPRDMGNFTVSQTGFLFYRHGQALNARLVWTDMTGKELGEATEEPIEGLASFVLSPDGKLAALARWTPERQSMEAWLLNLERKTLSRVTLAGTGIATFAFSPDSSRAVFMHSFAGKQEAIIRSLRGTGDEQLPMVPNEGVFGWSRDGRYLILDVQDPITKEDVYAEDLQGDRKPFPVVKTPASEQNPTLSPNGKWLAYESDESGQFEVYVTAFPGPGAKWQVSNSGGDFPQWSADGRQLFYVAGTKLVRVDITDPVAMQLGTTHEVAAVETKTFLPYQLAPDGKRVLINRSVGGARKEPVHVVAHWTELLKK